MEQQRALQLDGLRSSHPIQVPIAKAEQVEEVPGKVGRPGHFVGRRVVSLPGKVGVSETLQV